MVSKKGAIVIMLIFAVLFSVYSLSMTFFSSQDSSYPRGETTDDFGGNVRLEVLPYQNESSMELGK